MPVGDKERADPEGIEACQWQGILKKLSEPNAVYSVNLTIEVIQCSHERMGMMRERLQEK
jgi:hypothetical protein